MYRRLTVSLVLILGLVLAACGQTSSTSTSSGTASASAATSSSAGGSASPSASSSAAASGSASAAASGSAAGSSSASAATSGSAAAGGSASGSALCPPARPAASTSAAASASPSAAAGTPATLDQIKQRGQLIAGVKYDVPLFGYLNPTTNQVEGFDVEIAREVAKQIFGDTSKVQLKEAISRNRIPFLQDGSVDIVVSTMTANEDRAKQIDFSDAYYVAGQSLLVRSDSDIQNISNLAGRNVATVKGSTSEANIRRCAPQANVALYDSYSEAVQALQTNRADAVTTDDIILYGYQVQSNNQLKVVGGQFTKEPYAIGVAKGNTALLEQVNTAIRNIKQSGRWAEIYKQFIPNQETPPVPPQNWRDVK